MSPKTTNSKSALDELEALEQELQRAADEASSLAAEYTTKMRRLHRWLDTPGLLDRLRDLQHRDPAQFNADGSPRGPEAKKLQAEIDEIGDPQALVPRIDQARRVEAKAKQDVDAFVSEHLSAIVDELRAEAEVVAAEANAAAGDFLGALDKYLGFHQRVTGLVAAAGRDTRIVPGLDAVAEYRRIAQAVELPAPIPEGS